MHDQLYYTFLLFIAMVGVTVFGCNTTANPCMPQNSISRLDVVRWLESSYEPTRGVRDTADLCAEGRSFTIDMPDTSYRLYSPRCKFYSADSVVLSIPDSRRREITERLRKMDTDVNDFSISSAFSGCRNGSVVFILCDNTNVLYTPSVAKGGCDEFLDQYDLATWSKGSVAGWYYKR